MLRDASELEGLVIRASDGELGTVKEFYFDDSSWAIRYLVVETGRWLGGKEVLISPYSILKTDWKARQVDVALTKKQVENSPSVDTKLPVSRQHESDYLGYYGYPYYWGGPCLWGSEYYPLGLTTPADASQRKDLDKDHATAQDTHLRSTLGVSGYSMETVDGDIGHVHGFVLDEEAWAIRYIVVSTTNWWPGKKVLVSPEWIRKVSWSEYKLHTDLTREAIKSAPEYIESRKMDRKYEDKLHEHYGQPAYWLREAEHRSLSSLSSV
jgi:PRC-barrel domain